MFASSPLSPYNDRIADIVIGSTCPNSVSCCGPYTAPRRTCFPDAESRFLTDCHAALGQTGRSCACWCWRSVAVKREREVTQATKPFRATLERTWFIFGTVVHGLLRLSRGCRPNLCWNCLWRGLR